ncbi:hypothetical protein PspLS_11521 [Pyricularia sp. CBS 133598]|nr:hypothetical protein PspLS_11521 [Pyricularia sp. CBS 133598]
MLSSKAASLGHCATSIGSTNKAPLKALKFPTTGFEEIDPSVELEEEKLKHYHPTVFYPIHIGEVLNERSQVMANEHRYVVLKVFVQQSRTENNRELECFRHFQNLVDHKAYHGGHERVRFPERHFTIQSSGSTHDVLVLRPLGLSVRALQMYMSEGVFPELNVVLLTQSIRTALDYLRSIYVLSLAFRVQDIDGVGGYVNHWAVSAMKLKEVFVDQSLDGTSGVK